VVRVLLESGGELLGIRLGRSLLGGCFALEAKKKAGESGARSTVHLSKPAILASYLLLATPHTPTPHTVTAHTPGA
jgi:hypothetical protein